VIHGSGERVIHGSGERAIQAVGNTSISSGAMGPVEDISAQVDGSIVVQVAGQLFSVPDAESLGVDIGDYVVAGSWGDGVLDFLLPVGEPYVPSESEVWVVGAISSVSSEIGQFTIGGQSFDYSILLSETPDFQPKDGEVIQVSGLQPAHGSAVVLGLH